MIYTHTHAYKLNCHHATPINSTCVHDSIDCGKMEKQNSFRNYLPVRFVIKINHHTIINKFEVRARQRTLFVDDGDDIDDDGILN